MVLYADEVLKWRKYEETKNKEIFDFSKKPEIERKFAEMLAIIKERSNA